MVWILALVPLAIGAECLRRLLHGEFGPETGPGLPLPGLTLSFRSDGLSLLLATLIAGTGAIVLVYAGEYLKGHPGLGRFAAFLLAFMASMLGLVFSDHLIGLFLFWELTSLWSYLLIGFHHEKERARRSALQALVVTEIGGLSLLVGLLLLAGAGGAWEFSKLEGVQDHPRYPVILSLILLGAFTKSAQVPFHFWLPNAMEAPTPASAYLHAATMVKAGVYLLLRTTPILGGSEAWALSLGVVGALTLLLGAWLALRQSDLKRLLAYSTVASLGAMVLLIGVGTREALAAAILYLVAHALYKGSLFLGVGAVDHETGERDRERLGGLARSMPFTATAALLAALSMASMPPFLGYLAKETFFGAVWEAPRFSAGLTAASVLGNAFLLAVSLAVLGPFRGPPRPTLRTPHEAPLSLRLAPGLLAIAGLVTACLPGAFGERLVRPAAESASGAPISPDLAFWHGWTAAFSLSLATVALGSAIYLLRGRLILEGAAADLARRIGPDRLFERLFEGLKSFSARLTRTLQSGSLTAYVTATLFAAIVLPGIALAARGSIPAVAPLSVPAFEAGVAGLIVAATLAAVALRSMFAAIAAMGVAGYGIALLFVFYGAPDLAMTQFVVESLTVILYVLVFRHLPRRPARPRPRIRQVAVAFGAGMAMSAFLIGAQAVRPESSLRDYFTEASVPLARGRNVVNVILVDFRGIDTLGEITVLVTAAVGSFGLLRYLPRKRAP